MIFRRGGLINLVILFIFSSAAGQNIAFNHLTVENGLSQNSILSIVQDDRGFMWFGTRYGLNRFDGQRFRTYRFRAGDSTSLPDNSVYALFSDSGKTLWIGTTSGLCRYLPEKDIFERIKLNPGGQGNVLSITEDKKRRLWVGTSSGVYYQPDARRMRFEKLQAESPNSIVRCVYLDKQGIVWLGTSNGLTKLTETNGRFSAETFRHEAGNPHSLPMNFVTSITEDDKGQLWLGLQAGGVCLYEPARRAFVHFAQPAIINNMVRKIVTTRAGKIWVGTQEGLSIIDPVTRTVSSHQHNPGNKKSLSQNSIHSLFEDNSGSLWIGTYFGGINMVYSYGTSFSTLQSGGPNTAISNNVVSGILEDAQHNLWIGTEGGGLNYLDRKSGIFTYYKHDPASAGSIGSNLIKFAYEDKDRQLWVGTHGGGLNLLLKNRGQFKKFFHDTARMFGLEITALLEDHADRFWVGTNRGLHLIHRRGEELVKMQDSTLPGIATKAYVRHLFQDSRKRIWIATASGLYVLRGDTVELLRPDWYTNAIQEDRKGNLWVSLYYGGLAKYDAGLQHFTLYTEKDGLPNNNVMGLLEDGEGNLWISTDNGLVKFDPARKKFQVYTTSDGIAGNSFNYNSFLKDSRGEFFFGGYNGITSFFPEQVIQNTYSAPIVFTGLRLFNNPVDVDSRQLQQNISYTKRLRFKHDQSVFTIEFALLNYIKSSKNRYAYKLEGADRDWVETDNPAVTYTNLAPGNYTFRVKGANNDGVWSEPAQMEIRVLPPFWRTWWAYCIYALLLAALSFLVIRFFFLRALLRKEEELHQVKLNFFTHVSHEIRTHLSLLMIPLEKMADALKKDDPLQQPLFQARHNANRLLKLVSELMDFRKAETNHLHLHLQEHDLVAFLEEIYTSFRELSLDRNIQALFTHDVDEAPVYFDREQLGKVFFNLLSNAFKFTPDGGKIQVHVAAARNAFVVTVTDNGRGIAPEYLGKLFTNFFQVQDHGLQNTGYGIGLALSKNIVELHKGNLTVDSIPAVEGREGKTTFTVTLQQGKPQQPAVVDIPRQHPVVDVPLQPENQHQQETASPSSPFTIHIVEDNPELREHIRQAFGGQYHVLESANGAEGLELATTQIPDLVISDVMMPEMDGLSFCHQLKTDERTSHIPVILLTAKSSQADHVSGLETGADLYLTKPFSTKVLELNVRNLLASREKMRQRFSRQMQTDSHPVTQDTLPNTLDTAFLEKVMQLVDEHMDDPEFGVDMLARKVAMSQPVLYKKLKAVTNMSVNDFVKSLRLKKAAELIRQKQHTVYEVAYMVGYNDRKYFSREFKKQYGKTPTEFAAAPEL
jgi:ligand-binding sensor domain-containing protein/signal transduction histidine kinase/DNA-binding response OmpR family regulator